MLATTPFSFINIYLALKKSRNNAVVDLSESKTIEKRVIKVPVSDEEGEIKIKKLKKDDRQQSDWPGGGPGDKPKNKMKNRNFSDFSKFPN